MAASRLARDLVALARAAARRGGASAGEAEALRHGAALLDGQAGAPRALPAQDPDGMQGARRGDLLEEVLAHLHSG